MKLTLDQDRLLLPPETSQKLGIKTSTLAKWRSVGRGPRFVLVGRLPRYRLSDIDAWLNRNVRGGEQ